MGPTHEEEPRDSRLRLLVILPDAGAGGGVRVVGDLVREWTAMGAQVRTLSLATSSSTGREILCHAPHQSLNSTGTARRVIGLRRYLRTSGFDFDVIFAIGDYSAIIALVARRLLRMNVRPIIVNGVHQPRPYVTSIAGSRRTRLVRWLGIRGVLTALQGLDGYVFLSEPQKAHYDSIYLHSRAPRTVIPNPVRFGTADLALLAERSARLKRGDPIRLITVGSLNDQKNHALLLESFAQLDRRFLLSIVGRGEREAALRARIEALELGERVVLLGPREDVAELLDQHDLFILSSDFEASPLVVLEALVRGLPVIATDCAPNFHELEESLRTISIVPLRDANALASTINDVARNLVGAAELSQAAKEALRKHSPSRAAHGHLAFFRDVQRRST